MHINNYVSIKSVEYTNYNIARFCDDEGTHYEWLCKPAMRFFQEKLGHLSSITPRISYFSHAGKLYMLNFESSTIDEITEVYDIHDCLFPVNIPLKTLVAYYLRDYLYRGYMYEISDTEVKIYNDKKEQTFPLDNDILLNCQKNNYLRNYDYSIKIKSIKDLLGGMIVC